MQSTLVLFLCTILFIIGALCQVTVNNALNAPDMPGFTPNLETVPAGSIIIPMDPTNQVLDPGTGLMSVLPYGLVIRTLHDNVSIWWAIQTGKAANGADFVAATQATTFGTIVSVTNPNIGNIGLGSTTTTTYSGGPFIILQKDVQKALNRWALWTNSGNTYYATVDPGVYSKVAIHVLTVDTVMDIRHKIYVRPVVGISNLDGNAPTQTAMMGCVYQDNPRQCPLENGYGWGGIFGNGAPGCKAFQPQDHAGLDWNVHYQTFDCGSSVAALTDTTCLTTFSEPHWEWVQATGPSYISAMKNFIFSGANFFGQCASIQSYENQAGTVGTGTFMSKYGIGSVFASNGIDPPTTQNVYPDLPCAQFVGDMSSAITGAVPDFYNYFSYPSDTVPSGWVVPSTEPGPGGETDWYPSGTTTNIAFPIVTDITNSNSIGFNGRNLYVAAAAKYNVNLQLGSNVFYLGGHTWAGQAITGTENGRRFFFNAIIVPAARPAACGFTFCSATDTCPPQDACHTCACNAAGTGFVQTPIPGCCLNNAQCNQTCQTCNTASHTCTLNPSCCNTAAGINCPGSCQTCTNNVCTSKSGCCTSNSQCGSGPCDVCQNQVCVSLTASQCCDPSVAGACSSLGACIVCASNNTCVRNRTCCLANVDCGATPCDRCNNVTNTCYSAPGCCNTKADCGTNPCVTCVNNACSTNYSCCTKDSQCGACNVCNNVTNSCQPSGSTSCCTSDPDCGSCRRCATTSNGTRSCVNIDQCCMTSSDCELCENCTANQCTPISGCCSFDADCLGCEICSNYTCQAHPTLYCCTDQSDCDQVAAQYNNASCGYVCTNAGVCQQSCSSGANWLGLIIGLAAGVPLALLALLGLLALLAAFLYFKKDYLTEKFFQKTPMGETGVMSSPIHEPAVHVGTSAL